MKFKVGDIVFFKSNSFISKVIQFYNLREFGKKGFSHVGIVTKVLFNHVIIHEALSNGFTRSCYSFEYLNDKLKGDLDIKKPKYKLKDVYKTAEKYLGRSYAWFDIFGIILSFLFRFKFLKITGANKLICSEAVARILYDSSSKKLNISKEYNKPYDLISPQEVYMSKFLK